jgi:hypothetical protein
VSGYEPRCDVYGRVKIVDVYELYPNAHSLSAIDDKGAPASRGTAAPDRSSSDGGYSIGRSHGNRATVSAATCRNFNPGSNVTDMSDIQYEKHSLQSISTDLGIIIDVKAFI